MFDTLELGYGPVKYRFEKHFFGLQDLVPHKFSKDLINRSGNTGGRIISVG